MTAVPAAIPDSYCGAPPVPSDWLDRWNADPLLIAGLLMVAAALAWATQAGSRERRAGSGALGLIALFYLSPLCALGGALFTARVAHHLALAMIVAPLVGIAIPGWLVRLPGSLASWTLIDAAVLWAWHSPALYGIAATGSGAYWLMQASILLASAVFWQRLIAATAPAGIAALLAAMVQMGALGALITLAPRMLYPVHLATTSAWGLTPLEDQQIAGLVMWVPASAVYLFVALGLVGRMVHPEPAR